MKRLKVIFVPLVLISALNLTACMERDCIEREGRNCICTQQYDPVCGCNNKTYGNSCEAECAGITDYTSGPCN